MLVVGLEHGHALSFTSMAKAVREMTSCVYEFPVRAI